MNDWELVCRHYQQDEYHQATQYLKSIFSKLDSESFYSTSDHRIGQVENPQKILRLLLDILLNMTQADAAFLAVRNKQNQYDFNIKRQALQHQCLVENPQIPSFLLDEEGHDNITRGKSITTSDGQDYYHPIWYKKKLIALLVFKNPEHLADTDNAVFRFIVDFLTVILLLINTRKQKKRLGKIQRNQLIRQSNMATKGKYAARIGHEINNFLFSIGGSAELIKQNIKDHTDPDYIQSQLSNIASSVDRITRLSDALLNDCKIDSSFEEINLNEIILDFIHNTQYIWTKKGARFKIKLSNDLPVIIGDKTQIVQILLNLIQNAIQAKKDARITIRSSKNDKLNRIELIVIDNGPGISKEQLNTLFNTFKSSKKGGHGLGLGICREIMRNHKGGITVKSKLDVGTAFILWFPIVKSGQNLK